jgi:elongation factor G
MGDITGDLSSRRGQITGTRGFAGAMIVDGQVPLAELDGYSARLKSMTQGRGAWTMSLSHYEQAPPVLQQHLATEYKSKRKQVEEE